MQPSKVIDNLIAFFDIATDAYNLRRGPSSPQAKQLYRRRRNELFSALATPPVKPGYSYPMTYLRHQIELCENDLDALGIDIPRIKNLIDAVEEMMTRRHVRAYDQGVKRADLDWASRHLADVQAAKMDSQRLPGDLIKATLAVSRFGVSKSTLHRDRKKGDLTGYRPSGAKKNSPYLYSETDLANRYSRWGEHQARLTRKKVASK